jgi:hypothetical protein
VSASLQARLARAEAELAEQQRIAASDVTPLSGIDDDAFEAFLEGKGPRPRVQSPPVGVDRPLWDLRVRVLSAFFDLVEGRDLSADLGQYERDVATAWYEKHKVPLSEARDKSEAETDDVLPLFE